MPIHRFLQDSEFDPEHKQIMGQAFEEVLTVLRLVDRRSDPLCELIAKNMMEVGEKGVRDYDDLVSLTLAQLRGAA
jgi:hypothetical protein